MEMDMLARTMLFRGLDRAGLADALKTLRAAERDYPKGAAVLRAGDTTAQMGLVLSGSVTIESNDLWGNRTILSHVGPRQFFAETYALLAGEPLLVDVVANVDSRILFLYVAELETLRPEEHPWARRLTANLLRISAHKNLALSGHSFHTAPKSARGRVMAYLNSVSLQRRSREFDIPFDRQQLADYLNLDRSALSKELGRMRADGILECRKNHFRLKA